LVFVGLRDLEKEEKDFIQKNHVKVVKVPEVRKGKLKELGNKILQDYLGHCDILYVSFDIDSLDASLVPGTGTPVKNGLQVNETTKLLKEILKDPRLACFEVTEINPLLDKENQTAERIFPIFREAINTIEKSKKKEIKVVKKIEKAVKKVIKGKKVNKMPRVRPELQTPTPLKIKPTKKKVAGSPKKPKAKTKVVKKKTIPGIKVLKPKPRLQLPKKKKPTPKAKPTKKKTMAKKPIKRTPKKK
jgi:hypothetical protein